MKRILSALLCAAVLASGSVSASAAQLAPSGGDTVYSTRSSFDDLVQFEAHSIVHSGNGIIDVYITIPEDAVVVDTEVYWITPGGGKNFTGKVVFEDTKGFCEYSSYTCDELQIILHLSFPEGNITVEKTLNQFNYVCGMSHERGPNCI